MTGRSLSPELWKGVDASFFDFFERVTLDLGSTNKIMIYISVLDQILFIEIEKTEKVSKVDFLSF